MITIKKILTDFLIKVKKALDGRYMKKGDKQSIKDIIAEYNQEHNIGG